MEKATQNITIEEDLSKDHEFEMRMDANEMAEEHKSYNNEEPPEDG